jgi:hypothetical protein
MSQTASPTISARPPLTAAQRGFSLVEFASGAAIVVSHNVFHVLPNEVPILFVLAIASIRLREGGWSAIGLGRPKSWLITLLVALATALIVIAVQQFVTEPLAAAMGLHAAKSAQSALGQKSGDVWSLLKVLGISWTFAAFGEEIGYRRYLLGRAADLADNSTLALWAALVAVSVLFGIGHYYQGPAGMLPTACDGFIIGAAYLLSRGNLWVAVLAHGLIDTIVFGAVFLGLAN